MLTLLFGAYALVDGVFAIAAAVRRIEQHRLGGWLLFEGIVVVLAGLLAFFFTGLTAVALLYLIAFWAVLTGISEVAAAVDLRRDLAREWLLILSGIASVVFGMLLFVFPGAGIVAGIWIVGIYALIFGRVECAAPGAASAKRPAGLAGAN